MTPPRVPVRSAARWLALAVGLCLLVAFVPPALARPKLQGRRNVPEVLVVSRPWPPIVTVRAVVGTGSLGDPAGQEGLAQVCWTSAARGAGTRNRAQLAEALEALGAQIDVSVDKLSVTIVGDVLADQLDAFLPLFADVVLRPRFEPAEVDQVKRQLRADLVHQRDDDEALAHDAIGRYLFRGQPLGRPTAGTEASLKTVDAAAARAWHERTLVAGNLRLGFAGDIDADRARQLAEQHFADLPAGPPPAVKPPVPVAREGRRLLLLDKARRNQAQIVVAFPTLPAKHRDFTALLVANAVLGGAYSSRLTYEIRELRGWAYNTFSTVAAGPDVSTVVLGFGTAQGDAVAALDMAVRILGELQRDGITAAELRFAKDYLKGAHRFSLETADRELAQRLRALELGLGAEAIDSFAARVEAVDLRTVQRVLREQVRADDLAAVVVGPGRHLRDKLAAGKAGFGVEVVAADARPETTRGAGLKPGEAPPVVEDAPPPVDDEDAEPMGPGEDGEDGDGDEGGTDEPAEDAIEAVPAAKGKGKAK